jgi:eukaryotic-like serine/threonine-protein kinase
MSSKTKSSSPPRARDLFLNVLEETPAQRAAFLRAACGGDERLRGEVEELLREHEQLGDFLNTPAFSDTSSATTLTITTGMVEVMEKAGDKIGRYKLLQKIGEGGCGVVYMAEQEEPVRRRVALKIIKLGMDTKAVIARFEAERQALAMMEHPNIARVLDAGATETGRPYFVMELVRGVRITDYCDQNNLTTEERLQLFIQVCQAIQHAHQKGIIHRDIKPSNILVTLHDSTPVPKVIDFGIAKATEQRLTDKTLFTEFQSFIGTPAYMSPEQAEMSGLDIDTRSDIYALGVLLYEVLTGTTPFDARELMALGIDGVRKTIREKEPARPSTRLSTMLNADLTVTAQRRRTEAPKLIHSLRGDLDWIVMKCLEKDRTRRYPTANDVVADVQRFLEGETVLARPPSNVYLLQKFLRRHRRAVAAAVIIAVTLLAGITVSTWQAVRATIAERNAGNAQKMESGLRKRAERQSAAARLNEYVADMNLVQQSLAAENYGRAVQLLGKHQRAGGEIDVRGFEWRYLWQLTRGDERTELGSMGEPVQSVAVSPNGEFIAAGSEHKLNIWNARTKEIIVSRDHGATSLAFAPDGKHLLMTSPSERGEMPTRMDMRGGASGNLRVFSTEDWSEKHTLTGNSGPLSLSRDGRFLATQGRDGVRIWDTETWQTTQVVRDAGTPFSLSPDGRQLVAAGRRIDGALAVWTLGTQDTPIMLNNSTNLFVRLGFGPSRRDRALAFSPNGKFIAAARNLPSEHGVFVLGVWNAQSGEEVADIPNDTEHPEHTGGITSIVFASDGRTLVTGGMDHSIRVWDFEKRQRVRALQGNLNEVWAIACSREGKSVVSGSKDGAVNLWPVDPPQQKEDFAGARLPLGFSTNGAILAALNRSNDVLFLNIQSGEVEKQFQPGNTRGFRGGGPVAISADLRTLAMMADGAVKLWDTETRETISLRVPERGASLLGLSPDGRTLLTGSAWEKTLRWWDVRAGTNVVTESDGERPLFSPDSRTVALLSRDDRVEIWDVPRRSFRREFDVEPGLAPAVSGSQASFSPDGKLLAIACQDDAVRLWEVDNGKLAGALIGHKQSVVAVAFSPQGQTLATASDDSTLKFWNVATQQELFTIRRLGGGLRALTFSPDGRILVAGTSSTLLSGGLRVFRAPTLAEIDDVELRAQLRKVDDR